MGMGADGKMKELRAGTNGWMCMLDLVGDSMCLDKEWQAWGDAWENKKDPPKPKAVGVAEPPANVMLSIGRLVAWSTSAP